MSSRSPREKVRFHLRNLVIAAGAAGCVAGGKGGGGTADTGFAVVDPIPTPAVCAMGGDTLSASAVVLEDGNWELTLSPMNADFTLNGSVAAEVGEIVSADLETDGRETIVLKPMSSVLVVFGTCSDGSQTSTKVNVTYDGSSFQIEVES